MSIYVVYPVESARRSDGRNLFVVSAGSASAARAACEGRTGDVAGHFQEARWNAVALSDTATENFVAGPFGPVGRATGPWPKLTRGGNPLAN